MRNSSSATRFSIIIILVFVLALSCVVRLFDLQIVNGSEYQTQANQRLVRAYSITAPRGEILDCNDKALVKNRMGYSLQIQKTDITNDELNIILYDAAYLAASYGAEIESTFPIVINDMDELDYDFSIEENGGTRKVEGIRYKSSPSEPEDEEKTDEEIAKENEESQKALETWKKQNKLTDYQSPEHILDFYKKKYEVSSKFSDKEALTVTAIRYAMEKSSFSEKNPYTLATDIDEIAVQQLEEQFMRFPCVDVVIEPVRVFANGTMAAHILGRTGKIYAEEYAEMKDKGYGINDIIGKDGLEKVLEEYLKGEDGYESVEMNRGGGVSQILQRQEPIPGNFARLTINSDLQMVMESALRSNILASAGSSGAGAAIAVDPRTGGVLAMASYPTYDLTTFNRDYDNLLRAKNKPLINRVLSGTYSPGSTFKPLTSIAVLEEGIISPDTYIADRGKYTYYDSYQPTCLVYSSTGETHGTINVSEAIGVSCNYFFYEVGRQAGIEVIDEYATKFGLGQPTGIELPESTGILASPEHREKVGGTWYPGDVLQAAIGQSDNMFTPAQLAAYVSTILNKGTRYSLHLVNEIVDYDTKEVVYKKKPEILSENPITDSTYNAVKNGMRRVVTSGTAKAAFETSKYKAAGKTGTAEVPDGADNVLFVGFAPYDEPEIVIAVIIEHGANSHYPAMVARTVFDAYMEIKDGTFKSSVGTTTDERENYDRPAAVMSQTGSGSQAGAGDGTSGARPQTSAADDANASAGQGTL